MNSFLYVAFIYFMPSTPDMDLVVILDKDQPDLAFAEACALLGNPTVREGNVLVIASSTVSRRWERLAYAKYVGELVASIPSAMIESKSDEVAAMLVDYQCGPLTIVKPPGSCLSSAVVKDALRPHRDFPETLVALTQTHIHVSRLLWTNDKSFLSRKPQHHPAHHPAAIHPKLARAAINLTGLFSGRVHDPMCGVGGILIEAGLMGFAVSGGDIDRVMLDKARENCASYGVDAILDITDARTMRVPCHAIVTDVPYSKATKRIDDLAGLYLACLTNWVSSTHRAVVIFPDFVDWERIVEESPWRLDAHFTYYIHRTLSKIICVLRL